MNEYYEWIVHDVCKNTTLEPNIKNYTKNIKKKKMYIFIKIVLDGYTTWHYLSFDFGNVMDIFMEN